MWERSTYDAEVDEWAIPTLKPRKEYQHVVNLPSLTGSDETHCQKEEQRKKRKDSAKRQAQDAEPSSSRAPSRAPSRGGSRAPSANPTPAATPRAANQQAATAKGAVALMQDWGFADGSQPRSVYRPEETNTDAESGLAKQQQVGRIRPKSGKRVVRGLRALQSLRSLAQADWTC